MDKPSRALRPSRLRIRGFWLIYNSSASSSRMRPFHAPLPFPSLSPFSCAPLWPLNRYFESQSDEFREFENIRIDSKFYFVASCSAVFQSFLGSFFSVIKVEVMSTVCFRHQRYKSYRRSFINNQMLCTQNR